MRRDYKIRGYTVGHFPNTPIWVALGAFVVALLTNDGSAVNDLARAVLFVALTIWAYEEARYGVNGLRRGLGLVVLVLIVVATANAIAG